jgi:hypothetical protein
MMFKERKQAATCFLSFHFTTIISFSKAANTAASAVSTAAIAVMISTMFFPFSFVRFSNDVSPPFNSGG